MTDCFRASQRVQQLFEKLSPVGAAVGTGIIYKYTSHESDTVSNSTEFTKDFFFFFSFRTDNAGKE